MANKADLHNVTSAYRSRDEEIAARQRRYIWAMGSRVVLFGIAVVCFFHTPWLLYPAMAVSMVLPWLAVVVANGGRKKPEVHDAYVHEASPMVAIGPGGRTIDGD